MTMQLLPTQILTGYNFFFSSPLTSFYYELHSFNKQVFPCIHVFVIFMWNFVASFLIFVMLRLWPPTLVSQNHMHVDCASVLQHSRVTKLQRSCAAKFSFLLLESMIYLSCSCTPGNGGAYSRCSRGGGFQANYSWEHSCWQLLCILEQRRLGTEYSSVAFFISRLAADMVVVRPGVNEIQIQLHLIYTPLPRNRFIHTHQLRTLMSSPRSSKSRWLREL